MNTKKTVATTIAATMAVTSVAPALAVFANESDTIHAGNAVQKTKDDTATKEMALQEAILSAQKTVSDKNKELEKEKAAFDAEAKDASEKELAFQEQRKQQTALEVEISNEVIAGLETELAGLEKNNQDLQQAKEDKAKAEKDLANTEESLTKAQTSLKQEQEKLNQLKENAKDLTPEKMEALKNAIQEQESVVTQALNKVQQVEQALDTKQEELVQLEKEISNKSNSYTKALENQSKAEEDLKQAKATLDEKQKLLESVTDETIKLQLEEEIRQVEGQVVLKQESLTEYSKVVESTLEELTKATDALNALTTEKDKLELELIELTDQVEEMKTHLNQSTEELKTKEMLLDSLMQEDVEIDVLIQKQQENLETLEVEIAKLEKDKSIEEAAISRFQDAIEKYNRILNEEINLTSEDFFDSFAAIQASKILQTGVSQGTTHIGEKEDATSIENMRLALEQIKTLNKIRKERGLSELYVSHEAMAIGQVQANHSQKTRWHTQLHDVAENLAWGLDATIEMGTGGNPFDGWYTRERENFEQIVSENQKYQNMREEGKSDRAICDAIKAVDEGLWQSKIGHYANIMNEHLQVTGFGYTSARYGMSTTFSNVFTKLNGQYDSDHYTVDEYMQMLDKFVEENGTINRELLLQRLEQVKKDKESCEQELANIMVSYNEALQQKESAQQSKQQFEERKNSISGEKVTVQQSIEELNTSIQNMNVQMNGLTQSIQTKTNKLSQLQQDIDESTVQRDTVQKQYQEQFAQKQAKEKDLLESQTLLQSKETELAKVIQAMQEGKEKAQKEYDDALFIYQQAGANVVELNTQVSTLEKELNELNLQKEEQRVQLDEIQENKKVLEEELSVEQNKLKEVQHNYESALGKLNAVESSQAKMESLNTSIETMQTSIPQTKEKLSRLDRLMENLKEAREEKEFSVSQYKEAEAVWNAVKQGGNDSLHVPAVLNLVENENPLVVIANQIETYKNMRTETARLQGIYEEAASRKAKQESIYNLAKSEYEKAVLNLNKATQDLEAYLNSIKPQPKPETKPENKPSTKPSDSSNKKEETNTKKEETTNSSTSLETGMQMYSTLGVLAGTGFVLGFSNSKKRKDECR